MSRTVNILPGFNELLKRNMKLLNLRDHEYIMLNNVDIMYVELIESWWYMIYAQGSFCVFTQQMRDGVTL